MPSTEMPNNVAHPPATTRYVPNSGPPLAPLALRPAHDKKEFYIFNEIDHEGIPVYVVKSHSKPSLNKRVYKQHILDWVSPRVHEDFEAKQAEERLQLAYEEEELIQAIRARSILRKCRRSKSRRWVKQARQRGKDESLEKPLNPTESNGVTKYGDSYEQPSLSTPNRRNLLPLEFGESETEMPRSPTQDLPSLKFSRSTTTQTKVLDEHTEKTDSGRPKRKTRYSANYHDELTYSDLMEAAESEHDSSAQTSVSPIAVDKLEISDQLKLEEPYDYDDEPYWAIKSVLNDEIRTVNGKRVRFYHVDWDGQFSPTWEPEENLNAVALAEYTAGKRARRRKKDKVQGHEADDDDYDNTTLKRKRKQSKGQVK